MVDKGYEFFEHTADVGLRVYGATLPELFCRAAQGLVVLLIEGSAVRSTETRTVRLRQDSLEALFLAWLKELLFWFQTDRFLPTIYELQINGTELTGRLGGERFDPARHAAGTEVKGITYHQFELRQTDAGWRAQVIVDV